MQEEDKYNQARRILNIYKFFKTHRKMTSKEVISEIRETFPSYSDRSIQRDMKILADEGFIEVHKSGKNSIWNICKSNDNNSLPLKLRESELLSFHILKTYLKTFTGTSIEKDIEHLSEILETFAPGTVIMEEQFYGDQNIGNYDYSNKHEIIRQCIKHINEKNWIKIEYERIWDGKVHNHILFPNFLFTYAGTIYLAAYNAKYKKTNNFAIQNIITIEEHFGKMPEVPEFNYIKFRKQRFAVTDGDIEHVKLLITKDYVKYFENRMWHPTQKLKNNTDGTLLIEMDVPLSQEFISWICRWNEAIIVKEPDELIGYVLELIQNTLNNYKK